MTTLVVMGPVKPGTIASLLHGLCGQRSRAGQSIVSIEGGGRFDRRIVCRWPAGAGIKRPGLWSWCQRERATKPAWTAEAQEGRSMTSIKHIAAGLIALAMLTTSAMAHQTSVAGSFTVMRGHASVPPPAIG